MPRKVRRGKEKEWVYPHTVEVLAAAGLQPLRHYIDKRRNTIWKSVRSWLILEACMGAERREGTPAALIGGAKQWTTLARERELRRDTRGA